MTVEALKPDMTVEERAGWFGYCHEASLAEIVFMVENMSESCWDEIRSTNCIKTKREYLVEMLRGNNAIYCRSHDNEPRILGGIVSESPGVGTIWAISTDKATIKDWIFTTRGLNLLITSAFSNGWHRVQAFSLAHRPKSHRWLTGKRINMKQEAVLSGYFKDGFDVLLFSVLKGEYNG